MTLRIRYNLGMIANKKNSAAVSLGRLGGKARAKKLSKAELSEQGRHAVVARWAKINEAGEASGKAGAAKKGSASLNAKGRP